MSRVASTADEGLQRRVAHWVLAAILSMAVPGMVEAQSDDTRYNEYTIRMSDVPLDAPRFENFPATAYTGPNAAPLLTDSSSRMFRTRITEASRKKPNFAGHYILGTWGCGTDCIQLVIIDAKTGRVTHPPRVMSNSSTNVDDELVEPSRRFPSFGSLKFNVRSKLLVLIGAPEEDVTRRGISFYLWDGRELSLLRYVHKGWYSDSEGPR